MVQVKIQKLPPDIRPENQAGIGACGKFSQVRRAKGRLFILKRPVKLIDLPGRIHSNHGAPIRHGVVVRRRTHVEHRNADNQDHSCNGHRDIIPVSNKAEPHRQGNQNQTDDPELPDPPLDGRRIAHIGVYLFLLLFHNVFCLLRRPFHRGFPVKQPCQEGKHARDQQQKHQPYNGKAIKDPIFNVEDDIVDGVQNRGRREAKENLFHAHSTSLSDDFSVSHLRHPYKRIFSKNAQSGRHSPVNQWRASVSCRQPFPAAPFPKPPAPPRQRPVPAPVL